ncbi:MAG TPA: recombinase family protein [Acidobacteriaceae bacterium]|nr:recombinase family protein [Acidobacteriaceae bacterium]
MNEQNRAVLYARVSTDRQAEFNISIPSQLDALRNACAEMNWIVVREYADEGISGTVEERPQFQEMMDFVLENAGEVDVLFTYSFSRLARSVETLTKYLFTLRRCGIALRSLTQEYDDTPLGRLMTIMSGTVDEMRIAEDTKHTIRGLRRNAEEGFFNGAAPYGYKIEPTDLAARSGRKKLLVLQEEEADVIRQIWDMYEFGRGGTPMGMKQIAGYLNERSILRRRAKWTTESVRLVLSDEAYTGTYLYGSRGRNKKKICPPIVISIPQIILPDRFERIKAHRHKRSPVKCPPTHVSPTGLLTGIIRCGVCGGAMIKATGKSGRYVYYKCAKRNRIGNNACDSRNIPGPRLEALVLDILCERVLTPERYREIIDDCRRNIQNVQEHETAEARELKAAKKKLEHKIGQLCAVIEASNLRDSSYITRRARQLEHDLAAVEVKLQELKLKMIIPENSLTAERIPAFIRRVRDVLSDSSTPRTRAFLRIFVSEIRVYRDEATIKGPYLAAAQALAEDSVAHTGGVPRFTTKWRARQDSNL